ncbi:hypothetical protein P43SY_009893 [Pythium insidiosum]|uniref:MACPF domain-containing protein n=1 Tax=Pythium insidiosum TaxID=114742 RepID=A0AAD5LAH9_PYTIN|nr:hypothetical protein P43SY_009893 [Pythium insidiosum]
MVVGALPGVWTQSPPASSTVSVRPVQPPGIDYVGAGYDLVFGNPDGSEDSSSVTDPGFRVHVVKFTWNPDLNTCSGLDNGWICPQEVSILPQVSCMQQSSSSMISSTKSFQRVLQQDCKVSASIKGSYGGFKGSASFSGSRAMAKMQSKISKEKVTTFQSKAICVDYSATLKMGIDSNTLEPLPQFTNAVRELPTTYNPCFVISAAGGQCPQRVDNGYGDLPPIRQATRRLQSTENGEDDGGGDDDDVNDCACDASVAKYFRFIQLFGTHYTTRVEMGGKVVHRVEIKESDVSTLQKNKVDVAYGASVKASYKGIAKKEININVGGSPSEDWREWAKSTMTTPMPIRYSLAPLVDLIAKVDARKASLFEAAVDDYIAAYGRTLTFDTATSMNVVAVQIQYSMLVGTISSATFRVMIGKKGDMVPAVVVVNKASGMFNVSVPQHLQSSFDSFVGTVPVTLEYVTGVFTPPRVAAMESRAHMMFNQRQMHWISMEAELAMKKKKKKAPAAPSTANSVYFNTIRSFAVMTDSSTIPLDDQYAGKQLNKGDVWAVNPMD